ncbi:MAG: HPF/RaiA family ribosome-associated protein [Terriglobales bacterium]|jgi:DNA-directed RNA polymerase specialized sigma24 family protein/ribosome-associated translation inhibitor RaiA
MNVHVSYKVHKTPGIEKEISHQIEKIQKRLQVFRPELVHLKAIIDQNSAREGTLVSLNLRLPSGQLTAQKKAPSPTAAIKAAFDELTQQIGRHKELLRSSHKWRRWRGGPQESPEPGVPFEQTLAAVLLPTISADDIGSYVNANLSRLERFVDRELYFRRADEEILEDALSTPEVVDEVIARALGDHDRPEKLSLEPWLYRLALQAMNEMTTRLHELESPVHLEASRRRQNVEASDEAGLQFHQPDEGWTRESVIPDRRVSTPEQAAYSDEVIALVQAALRGADRTDREAFLLYGIEGFSLGEIAAITGRHLEAVRESVQRARDCVRSAPSIASEFHHELLVKTRT